MKNRTNLSRKADLLAALEAISQAAFDGATSCESTEDALDVIQSIESAARQAVSEYHGLENPSDPVWDAVWEPSAEDVADLRKTSAVPVDYSDVPF